MGTYPSKHKPNTPVWKPLRPMSAWAPRGPSLYVVLLYRPPLFSALALIVQKGPCRPFPHPYPALPDARQRPLTPL